jgi:hypothetical protein
MRSGSYRSRGGPHPGSAFGDTVDTDARGRAVAVGSRAIAGDHGAAVARLASALLSARAAARSSPTSKAQPTLNHQTLRLRPCSARAKEVRSWLFRLTTPRFVRPVYLAHPPLRLILWARFRSGWAPAPAGAEPRLYTRRRDRYRPGLTHPRPDGASGASLEPPASQGRAGCRNWSERTSRQSMAVPQAAGLGPRASRRQRTRHARGR